MKKRLAFVDHSYHTFTRSGDFLRDIFSSLFSIDDYYDKSWSGNDAVSIHSLRDYDAVFYFQVLHNPNELQTLDCPVLWAPMFDAVKNKKSSYWKQIRQTSVKILSFSNKVDDICTAYAIPFLPVRYYLKPTYSKNLLFRGNISLFYWDRGHFDFSTLLKLIKNSGIANITRRVLLDPGKKMRAISNQSHPDEVTTLYGELSKSDYLELVKSHSLFLAPRKSEGIGIATLEALASGAVILGYKAPTMNEYITHEVNGYLFDENTTAIDFTNFEQIRERSIQKAQAGYDEWMIKKDEIIQFIESPYRSPKKSLFRFFNL